MFFFRYNSPAKLNREYEQSYIHLQRAKLVNIYVKKKNMITNNILKFLIFSICGKNILEVKGHKNCRS